MITFDVRTAFLIIGLLYLLLPSITWVVLDGRRTPQVALWCGGGVLVGSGVTLVALRGDIPEWAALNLANTLIWVAHLARMQSLRLDLGVPWRIHYVIATVTAIALTSLGLDLGLHSVWLRAQFTSAVNATCTGYLALLAWRIWLEERSASAKWLAGVYALVGLAFLYRMYSLATSHSAIGDVLVEGNSAVFIAIALILSSAIGHFTYVGLALDRSIRRELNTTAEQIRNEERRSLSATIAQLDRQRSLGQMSASLAHELNQPLTATLVNAEVAKRSLQAGLLDTAKHTVFLEKIIHNTMRASQIIERIRSFIQPAAMKQESVNIAQIMQDVASMVANDSQSKGVVFKLPPFAPPHFGDRRFDSTDSNRAQCLSQCHGGDGAGRAARDSGDLPH